MDKMQSTSPKAKRAPISYSLLHAYAPEQAHACAANNSFDSQRWFKFALAAHMHDTAVRLQCSAKDIFWMFQFPYAVRPGECSSSGEPESFAGWLTMVTSHSACVAESLILEAEHEFLEVSAGVVSTGGSPSLLQQLQKDANTPNTPVDTGAPLDKKSLQPLFLCTGLDGMCCLAAAMKHIVSLMLHRSTSVLPFPVWKAACMRIVKWLQDSLEGMQKRIPDAEGFMAALAQQEGGGGEGLPELPQSAMPAAHLLMTRAMLREVIAVINESPKEV